MKLPKILFSKWFQWKERTKIKNIDSSGVYILARFKKLPSNKADIKDKNIVYIGETCNNSLNGRLRQFNLSAFRSKSGHSGGQAYCRQFKDKGENLFVAAFPVTDLPKTLRDLFIRYVERKLIFEFALEYGSQPQLNHK